MFSQERFTETVLREPKALMKTFNNISALKSVFEDGKQ